MGMLYVIHATGTSFYKIGITEQQVENRLVNLQTGNHCKLAIVRVYPDIGTLDIESGIHVSLSSRRTNGEWFDLDSPSDVDLAIMQMGHGFTNQLNGKYIVQTDVKSTSDRFNFVLKTVSTPDLGWLMKIVFFVWSVFAPISPMIELIEPEKYGLRELNQFGLLMSVDRTEYYIDPA